jgi:hypothetical protein
VPGISRRRQEGRLHVPVLYGKLVQPVAPLSPRASIDETEYCNLRGETSHSLARRRVPRQAISRSPLCVILSATGRLRNRTQNDHGQEGGIFNQNFFPC